MRFTYLKGVKNNNTANMTLCFYIFIQFVPLHIVIRKYVFLKNNTTSTN